MNPLARTDTHGRVAVISLDRADRHNALVPELLTDLRSELARITTAGSVHVVLLRAEGRSFSTGGDLAAFAEHAHDPDAIADYSERLLGELNRAVLALLDLPVPLVVAVDGPVTGGSIGLVAPGDVVVAGASVWLQPYYAQVGFSPDGGWTALLPRLVGRARVADTLLRDRRVDAHEAARWGLVSEVVDDGQVEARARAAADRIASLKPGAVAQTCRLLASDRLSVVAALEAEREAFCRQIRTDEARLGLQAFLAARRTSASRTGDV